MKIVRYVTGSAITGEKINEIQEHIDKLENQIKSFNEGRTEIMMKRNFGRWQSYFLTPEVATNEIIERMTKDKVELEKDHDKLHEVNTQLHQSLVSSDKALTELLSQIKELKSRSFWQRVFNKN